MLFRVLVSPLSGVALSSSMDGFIILEQPSDGNIKGPGIQ
jgi:hypothetical protein